VSTDLMTAIAGIRARLEATTRTHLFNQLIKQSIDSSVAN